MAANGKLLSGRTCLVTGGAMGLGRSIALEFLACGANVVICDINQKQIDSTSAELSAQGPTLAVQCDVTDASAIKSMVGKAVEHFGQLDVLVNCAGIFDRFEPVGELSEAIWHKVLGVNITGPYLVTREVVNHFLSRKATDASIVNVGSLASLHGWGGGTAYTVSKHAMVGLTKSTAAYYKTKGIRCNLVCPGYMNTNIIEQTPFSQDLHPEGKKLLGDVVDVLAVPISDTKEVAKLFAFLASNDSSALTGAQITVDKGQTLIL